MHRRLIGFAVFLALACSVAGWAATAKVFEFALPHDPSDGRPGGIVAGPDGALWFTEFVGDRIGRITITGEITEFPLPDGSAPEGIAAGPDGVLWFTEGDANRIGRISTSGTVTHVALPSGSGPAAIAAGPDGAMWFTASGSDRIGRIAGDGTLSGSRWTARCPRRRRPRRLP